jgi:hypothetical protein
MIKNKPSAVVPPSPWEPLHFAFAQLLTDLDQGGRKSFIVSFEIDDFHPYPYIQVSLDEVGDFVIEFTSNVYLEPDLNRTQIARLDSMGWRKPNGRNPNYTKIASRTQPFGNLARYITTTLRMVYELDESVWIIFGDIKKDFEIYSSDMFWHRLGHESVVCLPGRHPKETIEGIS